MITWFIGWVIMATIFSCDYEDSPYSSLSELFFICCVSVLIWPVFLGCMLYDIHNNT